ASCANRCTNGRGIINPPCKNVIGTIGARCTNGDLSRAHVSCDGGCKELYIIVGVTSEYNLTYVRRGKHRRGTSNGGPAEHAVDYLSGPNGTIIKYIVDELSNLTLSSKSSG